MENKYRVLLYYKYVPIEEPEEFTAQHLSFCKELGLLGRILISAEGINGTVSGTFEQTEQYMQALKADPRFADMPFKIDEASGHAFKKCMSAIGMSLSAFVWKMTLTRMRSQANI